MFRNAVNRVAPTALRVASATAAAPRVTAGMFLRDETFEGRKNRVAYDVALRTVLLGVE